MLRDRIVCGITEQQIQKKLLAEKVLTFDKAMKIALAVESVTKGARDIISGMSDSIPVHNMSDKTLPMIKCSHCGRGKHKAIECYGVRHIIAAPYHPSSNGLAERAIETCKAAINKMSSATLETKKSNVFCLITKLLLKELQGYHLLNS